MNKTIICYFSASGITKNIAEKLSSVINADLFEIKPVNKYTLEDLDWNDKNSRSSIEMTNNNSRPEITDKLDNIENYNIVLIGYPIWWDQAPRIINTFIKSINLENKKVYLFATSGGSGINDSVDTLEKEYPNINFINGKLLSKNITSEEITSWLGD